MNNNQTFKLITNNEVYDSLRCMEKKVNRHTYAIWFLTTINILILGKLLVG